MVFRVIRLQCIALIIAVVLAGVLAGTRGSLSAMIGGGAVVLPNALFALRLRAEAAKGEPGKAAVGRFFVYEFLKLALSLVLLAVAAALYTDLYWPVMLLAMVITLQVNFFVLAKRT